MICGRTMDPFFRYRTRGVLTECTLTNLRTKHEVGRRSHP